MKRRLALVCLLALASACVATLAAPALRTTLEVTNRSIDPIVVYLGGIRQGSVYPGSTECIRLRGLQEGARQRLGFRPLAGDAVLAPITDLRSSRGWAVEMGNVPRIDVLSLQPAERCK